jgi:hypothetical protein
MTAELGYRMAPIRVSVLGGWCLSRSCEGFCSSDEDSKLARLGGYTATGLACG